MIAPATMPAPRPTQGQGPQPHPRPRHPTCVAPIACVVEADDENRATGPAWAGASAIASAMVEAGKDIQVDMIHALLEFVPNRLNVQHAEIRRLSPRCWPDLVGA